MWSPDDAQGAESHKIRHMIVPYTRGTGLDLGCGPWKAWPHFIGVDNFDEWTGINWRPDVIADVLDLSMFADDSLDFIFSSHLLEHLDDTQAALDHWWSKIKVGGYLVLYLPHKSLYPNIGKEGANPDHKHDFVEGDIVKAISGAWDLVECQKRDKGTEYSFYMVFKKLAEGEESDRSYRHRNPKKKPTCLIVRYGAIGDLIMASSILPHLKEKGYYITFQTTPPGWNILRDDPHIDEFWLQDKDQVPNDHLSEYWEKLLPEFDRCINLSETVEGSLLAIPGRRIHSLSHKARHRLMDVNYSEFTHDVADVPHDFKPRFYATGIEDVKAQAFRAKFKKDLPRSRLILWVLAGSSIHKAWPWVDQVVGRLLSERDDTVIVFCGDKRCQMIEFAACQIAAQQFLGMNFEDSDEMELQDLVKMINDHIGSERLVCTSGDWGIRDTLSLLPHVDLIIGPETGVLNAASLSPVPKICMLSHSSHENLTKHWLNTAVVMPQGIDCYPCHRMHYERTFCPEDEKTGASVCAASISSFRIWQTITGILDAQEAA